MPYNPDNPPDVVKDLPKNKQRQWIEVWNSCHKKGQPEKQCFQTAWGVVKKASCGCGRPDCNCNCTPGQIIGPSVSEGALADATLNKDILDAKASQVLESVSQEIRPYNQAIAKELGRAARQV